MEVDNIEGNAFPDENQALIQRNEEISRESNLEQRQGLKRQVNLLGGIAILVGSIIGSGMFATPSMIASRTNSAGASLLIWAGCGVISMLCALVMIELGTMFPNSAGGEYIYLYKAFGPITAFEFSFVFVIFKKPASLCLATLICGNYIIMAFDPSGDQIHNRDGYAKLIAAVLIVIILIVNCLSVKWATGVQVVFTAAKMIAIVMLIITGLVRLAQGHDENFKDAFKGTNTGISDIGYAFYGGLWAYDGWNNLNYVTEELKNPIRDLPLAIMIGIPVVTFCYVLVNVAYLTVMTSAEIAVSDAVAVNLGYSLYGKMAWIIPVLVAFSTFSAANGSAFTSGRLVYVSAREGHMPKLLAMVHKKRHTPLPALVFTCFMACIMLIPESLNFSTLVNYFNFAAWTFYGATFAALLWLRYKQPELKRPYKVFIGIPIVVLLCSVYLVVAPFYEYPMESLYCLLFILFGIPIYFAFVRSRIFPIAIYNGFDNMTHKMEEWFSLTLPDEIAPEMDEIETEKQKQKEAEKILP